MKALIKYLPVEGEIKEGNYYDVNGVWNKAPSNKGAKEATKQEYKPLKLFVVTQDIKVGNKVRGDWKYYRYVVEIKDDEILLCNSSKGIDDDSYDDYWYNLESLPIENFKILGEVSPEATFVKDGNEYEVAEIYTKKDVSRWKGFKEYKYISKKTYKIKCPCCGDFK